MSRKMPTAKRAEVAENYAKTNKLEKAEAASEKSNKKGMMSGKGMKGCK